MNRQKSIQHGFYLLSFIVKCILKLISYTFLSWLTLLIIAFAILIFSKQQNSIIYFQQLLGQQIRETSYFPQTAFATKWVNTIFNDWHQSQIIVTQALTSKNTAQAESWLTHDPLLSSLNTVDYSSLKTMSGLLLLVSALIPLRSSVFLGFMPVFLLAAFLGLIEGLVQRNLRKLHGGRESALLHHRARQLIMPCLFLSCFLYLALPFYLTPSQILLPFAILFGVLIAVTVRSFKKYL